MLLGGSSYLDSYSPSSFSRPHHVASDRCQLEKRKTINGEDILWAMQSLGFENYAEVLKIYLAKYREVTSPFQFLELKWAYISRGTHSCSCMFPLSTRRPRLRGKLQRAVARIKMAMGMAGQMNKDFSNNKVVVDTIKMATTIRVFSSKMMHQQCKTRQSSHYTHTHKFCL